MPEAILNAYNILDAQSKQSVMDYINFLVSNMAKKEAEETHSKQDKSDYFAAYGKINLDPNEVTESRNANHRYKAFLDLAGKVDIDENAIQHLREISVL